MESDLKTVSWNKLQIQDTICHYRRTMWTPIAVRTPLAHGHIVSLEHMLSPYVHYKYFSTRQCSTLILCCLLLSLVASYILLYVQGDSRGKVNTLRSDGIGHCERKFIQTCVYFLMVTEIELFESTNANAWCVVKKEKLLTVHLIFNFSLIFKCLTNKFVTVHKCPKIPWSKSVHFATRVRKSLVVWVDFFLSSRGQQHRKC